MFFQIQIFLKLKKSCHQYTIWFAWTQLPFFGQSFFQNPNHFFLYQTKFTVDKQYFKNSGTNVCDQNFMEMVINVRLFQTNFTNQLRINSVDISTVKLALLSSGLYAVTVYSLITYSCPEYKLKNVYPLYENTIWI